MKTYTKRTNAKRAAIATGISEDQVEITVHKAAGEKPRFGFKRKETSAQTPAKAAGKAKRAGASKATAKPRESAAGITRPRAGGKCAAVWSALDSHPTWQVADARAWAMKAGQNVNNVVCEFYRWRRFTAAAASVG